MVENFSKDDFRKVCTLNSFTSAVLVSLTLLCYVTLTNCWFYVHNSNLYMSLVPSACGPFSIQYFV